MNWGQFIEVGAMLGLSPRAVLRATLPELKFAMRGYERAHGIDPDSPGAGHAANSRAMSRDRLNELLERYG